MTATDDAAHPSSPRPLTPQQLRFVQEVRRDGQATPAARRAGYSPRSARWAAYRLMRDPRVRAQLALPRPGQDEAPGEETGAWALAELKRLAAGNILDFAIVRPDGALEVDLARLERDRTAAVREVTVVEKTDPGGAVTRVTRLKLADKSLALARLLRFSALWDEGFSEGSRQGQGVLLLQRPEALLEQAARMKRDHGWVDPPAR